MGCNPCCCFSLKDSAITIGIWTLVYALASMCLFGWQTGVLNHCRSVTMAQANLQCEWDCPCVGASTKRTTSIIEGLFVIQVLCLISAFFLLFASIALIYGIHTWSRYLVWPWFPCIVSSILCSLAYCIMWWAGDVRDYWLALTILEIIGVVINVYCVVVVLMYYRRIAEATDQFQNKMPKNNRVTYKVNKSPYPRYDERDQHSEGRYPGRKSPYPGSYKELPQYPRPTPYDATGMPQTPLPLPPNYTPYPMDPNEMVFAREPHRASPREPADPVTRWVHSQQKDRNTEVNSEPISPSREVQPTQFPLQHSRSVPSMFDGTTLVSHRDCDHRKSSRHHRSSSRYRHRSKGRHEKDTSYSSDSETRADHRRDGSRRRHKSRSRYSESEMTETTVEPSRHRKNRRHDEKERDDRHRHDEDGRGSRRRHHSRDRHRSDRDDVRGGRRDREESDGRNSKRKHRHRKDERKPEDDLQLEAEDQGHPMSGGFAIPWNVVIPPSSGERGPDGQPVPQKLLINSEITINYDQNTSQSSSNPQRTDNAQYRREKYQPMQITSNV